MMTTKNEYLLEKIAERLGVNRSADPAFFAPDPLALLKSLADLLADPKAAQKNAADLDKATAANEAAKAERQKAADDRKTADAKIKAALKEHNEKLVNELAEHTTLIARRNAEADARERAISEREHALDEREQKLAIDRATLDKKLAAVRDAAAA